MNFEEIVTNTPYITKNKSQINSRKILIFLFGASSSPSVPGGTPSEFPNWGIRPCLSLVSKGVLQKKNSGGSTNQQKSGNKSDQIRIDLCWFHVLFADPTDTWRLTIGFFFIYFFIFLDQKKQKKEKIKKLLNPI